MVVLVDYWNVSPVARLKGPFYLVAKILETLDPGAFTPGELVRFRFYGGWDENGRMSREAQDLSLDLHSNFPAPISIISKTGRLVVRVSAELAQSLEVAPTKVLTHTFRVKGLPPNLSSAALPFPNCVAPNACPLAALSAFFQTSQCQVAACPVSPETVIFRKEQKLVDTMITADLIHFANRSAEVITIVSNDDDMWPGIQSALELGATIMHIHPKLNRTTPSQYASLATSLYSESTFSSI